MFQTNPTNTQQNTLLHGSNTATTTKSAENRSLNEICDRTNCSVDLKRFPANNS